LRANDSLGDCMMHAVTVKHGKQQVVGTVSVSEACSHYKHATQGTK